MPGPRVEEGDERGNARLHQAFRPFPDTDAWLGLADLGGRAAEVRKRLQRPWRCSCVPLSSLIRACAFDRGTRLSRLPTTTKLGRATFAEDRHAGVPPR
jgi:hypothetical protein